MYDDLYNVDFKLKFIFQIIAAKILIDYGFVVDNLHGVFGIYEINRIFSQLLSIFIITAIINAINFIDGIDGLAITVVTLFIFLFESLSVKYTSFFNLSTIIVFSIIPALVFNYRKDNKVFLGDSGSLFLGGLLSVYIMHIISPEYLIRKTFDINKIFYVFSIFIYPTIDLCRIVFLRLIKGKSPFEADRNHIHHYLIDKFQDHHKVVIIIMIFSLIGFTSIHLLI
jgi:UDP-N-acetylmuramyl pentapeptide phosphotransferase/UDP-N-acetylglucosamine-1-phosphate transferase